MNLVRSILIALVLVTALTNAAPLDRLQDPDHPVNCWLHRAVKEVMTSKKGTLRRLHQLRERINLGWAIPP